MKLAASACKLFITHTFIQIPFIQLILPQINYYNHLNILTKFVANLLDSEWLFIGIFGQIISALCQF